MPYIHYGLLMVYMLKDHKYGRVVELVLRLIIQNSES